MQNGGYNVTHEYRLFEHHTSECHKICIELEENKGSRENSWGWERVAAVACVACAAR
jgi:hypothetical protein